MLHTGPLILVFFTFTFACLLPPFLHVSLSLLLFDKQLSTGGCGGFQIRNNLLWCQPLALPTSRCFGGCQMGSWVWPCWFLNGPAKIHAILDFGMLWWCNPSVWQQFRSFLTIKSALQTSCFCYLHVWVSAASPLFTRSCPGNEECFGLIASLCLCATERRIWLNDHGDLPTHSLTYFNTVLTLFHHPDLLYEWGFFLPPCRPNNTSYTLFPTTDTLVCPRTGQNRAKTPRNRDPERNLSFFYGFLWKLKTWLEISLTARGGWLVQNG